MQVPREEYRKLVDGFIEAANTMKNEGQNTSIIANAMMEATAIYATYASAGNEGYLHDSGVDKLSDVFKDVLMRVQKSKKIAVEKNEPWGSSPADA